MVDLTKLILHSAYPAFKNNNIFTGTLQINGTVVAGTNTKTFTVDLGLIPDMTDVMFNGPTDTWYGSDPRPASGWFKQGQVWVRGDSGAYPNYGTNWRINSSINGSILTITAVYVQQFIDTLSLTSTNFSYRLIDYSAF